jgi:hypothetical protein
MIRMVIVHGVKDYGTWRRAYNGFDKERRKLGVKGHAVYRNAAKPKEITVMHDFATLTQAKSFAKSKRLREVMKDAGVRTKPDIWFVRKA